LSSDKRDIATLDMQVEDACFIHRAQRASPRAASGHLRAQGPRWSICAGQSRSDRSP